MAKSTQKLPPKLEAVLIRLGKSRSLNVTQAVKLPYLVDVVAMRVLGRRITEGTHQAWDHGVVTNEVWHYLTKCEDSEVFHLDPVPWSEEQRVVIDVADSGELALEERAIVDFVAETLVTSAGQLGRATKFMNAEISTWGSNEAANLGPDAFDRLSPDYQRMASRVAALTLADLRSNSTAVVDIEDAVA